MNDRGKMWRHVYKVLNQIRICPVNPSHCKYLTIVSTVDQRMLFDGEKIISISSNHFENFNILTMMELIRVPIVISPPFIAESNGTVRSKAKELTALLQDDERLRQERANRSNMQSRMNSGRRSNTMGSPVDARPPQRRRGTRRDDDNDDEMRRAIEASKRQADEDEKKRRAASGETDDDIAKAIKLSKEEEELRQSRLEEKNANLLFDDAWDQPVPQQQQAPQPVYQQQQQVDFWGNPIDMTAQAQQQQSTGYLQNVYSQPTGFLPQQTGYMQPQPTATNGFNNDFSSNNPYMQSQPPQFAQQTGFQAAPPVLSTMSNNPYAQQQQQQQQPEALQPMPTGSNNPFAQFGTSFNQQQQPLRSQQQQKPSFSPSLSTLSEQPQPQFQSPQQTFTPAPKPQSAHQNKLDFLLAQGNPTGQDTFGNTGELRVPAHFNRTGYVNSAGQGLRPSVTGYPTTTQQPNNPFFTGQNNPSAQGGNMRPLTQSTTGPAYGQQPQYGQYGQQNQQGQTGSLIDF